MFENQRYSHDRFKGLWGYFSLSHLCTYMHMYVYVCVYKGERKRNTHTRTHTCALNIKLIVATRVRVCVCISLYLPFSPEICFKELVSAICDCKGWQVENL